MAQHHPRRAAVVSDLESALDAGLVTATERGIFNATIRYCSDRDLPKSWASQTFAKLYDHRARCISCNDGLIQRIAARDVPAEEAADLRSHQMDPEAWREAVDRFEDKMKSAYEHRVVAMTDQYRCGKCKQRKCTYQEFFSRSADEGSVMHIRCLHCGHAWRMS
jgi:DNA-directed RNA polymerase subunit M/transcription elongation factor TFIIS